MQRNKLESLPEDLKQAAQKLIEEKFPSDKKEKVDEYPRGEATSAFTDNRFNPMYEMRMTRITLRAMGMMSSRLEYFDIALPEGEIPDEAILKAANYLEQKLREPVVMVGEYNRVYFMLDSREKRLRITRDRDEAERFLMQYSRYSTRYDSYRGMNF